MEDFSDILSCNRANQGKRVGH